MERSRAVLVAAVAAVVAILLAAAAASLSGQRTEPVTWDDLASIDSDSAEAAMALEQGDEVLVRNVTAFAILHAGVPQDIIMKFPFDWNSFAENTGLMDGVEKGFADAADTRDLDRILRNSEPLAEAFDGGVTEPFFYDGLPQPVFPYTPVTEGYTNEDSATVRYCVYVETEYDTDSDGKRDLINVYLQVPRAAMEGGYQAPVILIASPYDHGASDKDDVKPADTYDMSRIRAQPDPRVPDGSMTAWDAAMAAVPSDWYYGEEGLGYKYEHSLDYFLPRGYAVAECGLLGSYGSEGYACTGLDLELLAVKSVIDWFDGDAVGYISKDDLITTAADWCSGAVGMYGGSYLGTMQVGVAAMGIDNLKTVIPSSAISDWYEYCYAKGAFITPACNVPYIVDLAEFVSTNRDPTVGDYCEFMQKVSFDEWIMQGQYADGESTFWMERDYSLMEIDTETSFMLVHGINDHNVKMNQLARTMEMFEGTGITMKVFLHQGAHQMSNNKFVVTLGQDDGMVAMNKWLSRYLFGKDTGVENWPDIQVQSNIDGSWSGYESLDPSSEASFRSAVAGEETFYSYVDDDLGFEIEMMTADSDMTILGGEFRLRLTSETAGIPNQPVSVILYDRYEPGMKAYHNSDPSNVDHKAVDPEHPENCAVWFGSTIADPALSEFELKDATSREVSMGSVGLGFYGEKVAREDMRVQEREPGTYYDYVMDLIPTVYELKEGHSLVAYICGYNPEAMVDAEDVVVHYDVTVDLSSVELVMDLARTVIGAGKVTVTDSVVSVMEDHMVITTARSETTSEGTTALAGTIIQPEGGILDAATAAAALGNLDFVVGLLGVPDVEMAFMVMTGAPSVTVTGDALEEFAEADLGLRFAFEDGTLHYDDDATDTLAEHGDVEVSMTKDDESVLTEAQKNVVGDASFVSVTAMAGQTYIRELDGTVTISYAFSNPQGWKEFAAYHIAEDGKKTAKEWDYNEGTGQVTIYSDHHSIYAMLEETGPSGSGSSVIWIAAGIVAVLVIAAVAFFAVRSRKAGNRFETGGGSPLLPFSIPHRERSSCQAAWMDSRTPVISEQYISDAHDS